MKRYLVVLVAFFVTILTVIAVFTWQNNQNSSQSSEKDLVVVTTIFPLYDIVRAVGGDNVRVSMLIPPGVEIHHFEPTPSDIISISKSDVFIYLGDYLEPWAQDVVQPLNKDANQILAAGQTITLLEGAKLHENEEDEHEEDVEHEDEHEHEQDPHVWLDFENTATMTTIIADRLSILDPDNASSYRANAGAHRAKLQALDETYKQTLSTCQSNTIIYGGHYAFGYLANRYGLSYMAAQGFSPDAEPTATDIALLARQIKDNNIRYVFYEKLESERIAMTLTKETGATLLALQAAHNISAKDLDKGTTFIDMMNDNLSNLRTGLSCTYE
ncbi:MAG TPA: metal ABC transporter substrate-binding protein [Candidatus Woesebacteria bacterium]|nr:metal ABC transporter substrate-binding protein [Candidatus Woesebacteria bacterium]HNS95285.1 metal ABC transporter substrate-binding protein [Candidatus Woesebacteria bacterium]